MFAAGHAQLPLHQVEPGDGFGDGVLHLQACVHLHEVELAAAEHIGRCDELHRAGAHIAHAERRLDRGLAQAGAKLRVHAGRRGFFQHLLVSALHRAVTLEEVHALPEAVGKDLHLDVPGLAEVFL